MSDRGIPTTDGAPACPFVAFDDDRDARSTAPDHRHRCFAEPVPAPRAIAHQDAYCLSPAFAVCPAFQDWARREAAAARPVAQASAPGPATRAREDDTSGPVPMAPPQREPQHAPTGAAQPVPSRKPPARDWAAPPPWVVDADAPSAPAAGSAPGAIPGWGAAAGAAAVGGAAAASRSRGEDDWGGDARGLADSAAARLAGPDPGLPTGARPTQGWALPPDEDDDAYDERADERATPSPRAATTPPAAAARPASASPARPVPPPRQPSSRDGARPAPQKEGDGLFGPAWERPRRYEAYPSLRTRVGLPSLARLPRLAIAAGALVIAAAFLFFVSPMILGLGGKNHSGATPPPSSAASAAPSDTPAPTVPPAPTPFLYTIAKGDTLSAIASRYSVTVKAILKANPQIKNQNSIKEGDQITIPAPAGATSSGVTGASPSAVSGASTGP